MTQAQSQGPRGEDELEGLDPRRLMQGALGAEGEPEAAEEDKRLREEIARRLPDLEVLELLGRGGMGVVYKARQRRLDRMVALKVLTPREDLDAGLAERFEREARTLAKLAHAHIVAIHDYGRDGSFCWIAMEFVDGTTLRQLLDKGGLEPRQALALVGPLCEALQYAHEQGVVHRDIKPENVLVDRQGRVKVADFGLAKLLGEPAALVSLTATRQVLGTLRYMAPEQLERPLQVDHRADIYALGVVLYEMLTGEVPVGRFALPSERVRTPPRLDQVVLRSMEREPAKRYQSASAVRIEVQEVDRDLASGRTPVLGAGVSGVAGEQRALRLPGPDARVDGGAIAAVGLCAAGLAALVLVPGGAVWCFLLISAACFVGWMSLDRIRSLWPQRIGVAGAAIGAWLLPFVFMATPFLFLFLLPAGGKWEEGAGRSNGLYLAGTLIVSIPLMFFGLLVYLYRARFLRKVGARR